jgi:hypothetical protein
MKHLNISVLAAAATMTMAVASAANPTSGAGTDPDFETLKKLVGEWQVDVVGKPDWSGTSRYQMTSANSALLETLFVGTSHEMTDVYTRDRGQLVMTHYCASGNQPHLQARPNHAANELSFDFVSAGNLPSLNDPHMHSLKITFVDDNDLKEEWQTYIGGKPVETVVLNLKRKT